MTPDPQPETIPYCRHFLAEEEVEAAVEVLRSGWIARGPRARDFEQACARLLGASHAVSCASGSAALELALRALGVGPGDEVIVPTLTWVATASAVRLVGARPVFADVDAVTHNIELASIERIWSERTAGVIAVDFAGVPHDVEPLRRLCQQGEAWLLEDAAHAFGSRFPDDTPVGGDGKADVTTFSFHPAKTITTGEGGLVTTADAALAGRLRTIRSGGISREFEGCRGPFDVQAIELGSNYHMTEIQAAIGLVQLDRLESFLRARREACARLSRWLQPLREQLLLPCHPRGSSFNLFVVELEDPGCCGARRDQVIASLHADGIRAHMHYPLLHRQPIFRRGETLSDSRYPNAVRYEQRALTLPLFPGITDGELKRVADGLQQALAQDAPALVGGACASGQGGVVSSP